MIPINVRDSQSAARVLLRFRCPDPECGHEALEPLSRFHARYKVACPVCGIAIDLKAKEHRIVIEEAVKFCRATDARLQKGS